MEFHINLDEKNTLRESKQSFKKCAILYGKKLYLNKFYLKKYKKQENKTF